MLKNIPKAFLDVYFQWSTFLQEHFYCYFTQQDKVSKYDVKGHPCVEEQVSTWGNTKAYKK